MDSWGGTPTAPGWYACVVDYGRLPFPAANCWSGSAWDHEPSIKTFDGPYESEAEALNCAMERCPED